MKIEKILLAVVGVCLVGLGGYWVSKNTKKTASSYDGNKLTEELKNSVKYPERLVLSPDPSNKEKVQLSYTYLSDEDGEVVAEEILTTMKNFYTTINKEQAPVSLITIVSFNPKTKKPLRLLLGSEIAAQNADILNGKTSTVIVALKQKCQGTRADVLATFCNVSDALVESAMGDKK